MLVPSTRLLLLEPYYVPSTGIPYPLRVEAAKASEFALATEHLLFTQCLLCARAAPFGLRHNLSWSVPLLFLFRMADASYDGRAGTEHEFSPNRGTAFFDNERADDAAPDWDARGARGTFSII